MGPLAGIGDTITWGMLKTIIYGIGCTMAATGNIMGALITIIFPLITFLISGYLFNMGYHVGREDVYKRQSKRIAYIAYWANRYR